ncbi:MAG: hypothetical protein J6Q61_02795 [Bacteroidales bacterium]|nr:hypothetical protein [Bacteroidales bacterium]MBO5853645.1 hypothetical protein [Bacteroidales bacterium]
MVYTPNQNITGGLEGDLQIAANGRELARQMFQAAFEIQQGEDNLRRSIIEQQNKVALLDAKNKLSAINKATYENFKFDPERFKVETNEQASDVINELPMLLRGDAKDIFTQEQNDYYYRAFNNQREYLDRQTSEQTQVAIKNCGDKAIKNIENMLLSNPSLKANAQAAFGFNIGEFNGLLEAKNSYGLDIFNEGQKDKLRQDFYGSIFQRFAELKMSSLPDVESKLNFIKEVLIGEANIELDDGTVVSNDILHYGNRQVIARALSDNLKSFIKQQQTVDLMNYAKNWIGGNKNVFVPPAVHDKAMGLYYKQARESLGVQNIAMADEETRGTITRSLCDFIEKSEVLVDELKDDLKGMQDSGIPGVFEVSANVISFIQQNRDRLPKVIQSLDEKNFAESLDMVRMSKLKIPAEQSFSMIETEYRKMSEEQRKVRGKQFSDKLHDNETFTPAAIFNVSNPDNDIANNNEAASYMSDYIFLAQKAFMSGASIQASKQFADTFVLKKWSRVNIDGKTYFRAYSPEKFYSVPGYWGTQDINMAINNKAKSLGIEDSQNAVAIADEQTYSEIGGKHPQPTYGLWVYRDGVPQQVINKKTGKQERMVASDFMPKQMSELSNAFQKYDELINNIDIEIANTFKDAENAVSKYLASTKGKMVEWGHYLYKRHEAEQPFVEKRKQLKKEKAKLEKEKESATKPYKNTPSATYEQWKRERNLK